MSKRIKSSKLEQPEPEQPEPEQPERSDEIEQPQEVVVNESVRVCISCGSSANLFKTKAHKRCIECLNLRPAKTEKQLKSFEKAREKRMENIERRKKEIEELEKQAQCELDKKIINKAISIKKKMIKQNAQLDEISDDDTPLEEVIELARKKPTPAKKPKSVKRVKVSDVVEQYEPEPQYQQPQYVPQIRTFNFL